MEGLLRGKIFRQMANIRRFAKKIKPIIAKILFKRTEFKPMKIKKKRYKVNEADRFKCINESNILVFK
jgi:hypothetical protein